MKNAWIWVVVVVLVLGVGYYFKHQIKLMLTGAYSAPTTNYASYGPAATPVASTAPLGNILTWSVSAKGEYAVGANNMTLYTFDKDTKGVSNCNGSCAGLWPPYTTASAPSTLPAGVTLITRSDGSMQFAYKGMPLYYYSADQAVGDMNGDGFNGVWHIVKQ